MDQSRVNSALLYTTLAHPRTHTTTQLTSPSSGTNSRIGDGFISYRSHFWSLGMEITCRHLYLACVRSSRSKAECQSSGSQKTEEQMVKRRTQTETISVRRCQTSNSKLKLHTRRGFAAVSYFHIRFMLCNWCTGQAQAAGSAQAADEHRGCRDIAPWEQQQQQQQMQALALVVYYFPIGNYY